MKIFIHTFVRDLKISIKKPSIFINPLLFFIISVSLFPLSISPESKILIIIAPGIICVSCMLAIILSLNSIFNNDYENGVLEQIIISKHSLAIIVFAKTFINWILTGIPIILLSPILGSALMLNTEAIVLLLIILLITTPILSLIGVMGAALIVGIKNSGMLLSLLVMPLYIPILIFASSAISQNQLNSTSEAEIYFLISILFLALISTPFISSVALKTTIE